jgi:hypothetical protein
MRKRKRKAGENEGRKGRRAHRRRVKQINVWDSARFKYKLMGFMIYF